MISQTLVLSRFIFTSSVGFLTSPTHLNRVLLLRFKFSNTAPTIVLRPLLHQHKSRPHLRVFELIFYLHLRGAKSRRDVHFFV